MLINYPEPQDKERADDMIEALGGYAVLKDKLRAHTFIAASTGVKFIMRPAKNGANFIHIGLTAGQYHIAFSRVCGNEHEVINRIDNLSLDQIKQAIETEIDFNWNA